MNAKDKATDKATPCVNQIYHKVPSSLMHSTGKIVVIKREYLVSCMSSMTVQARNFSFLITKQHLSPKQT